MTRWNAAEFQRILDLLKTPEVIQDDERRTRLKERKEELWYSRPIKRCIHCKEIMIWNKADGTIIPHRSPGKVYFCKKRKLNLSKKARWEQHLLNVKRRRRHRQLLLQEISLENEET